MTTPDLDGAAAFLAGSARVLEKRRFERLFADGAPGPVRDAVAAYRNPDGGFGHGMEPDCRCPASQPAAAELALRILDEAGEWDSVLVGGACDWLQLNSATGGGATFVEATVDGWPHAPWWVPEEGRPASLIATGLIAGTLHHRGVAHPWLDRATEVMWARIDELVSPGAYEMLGVMRFLDCVPDRARAERAFATAGPLLLDGKLVALDPDEPGEVHSPLAFAPAPGCLARQLFDDKTIAAHLDKLAAGQASDGGWTFNWLQWSPAATLDWRGFVTIEALTVLRGNGRLGAQTLPGWTSPAS
ncbi:MAG TPA: hypothetical protein VGS19_34585 [Streptosporangiaceae bacterium]|nr:hypothetical protein [Streptosporangiaceae bacterium]